MNTICLSIEDVVLTLASFWYEIDSKSLGAKDRL